MGFAPGDRVHLPGLGTGVVREARSGRRYVLDVNGRSVVAREGDLQPANTLRRRRAMATASTARQDEEPARARREAASLDLHGKTVAESLDALDAFINDALLDGCREVRIIHGVSGGKVKRAVHQRLRQVAAVRSFRIDPLNAGATIVTFA